MYSRSAGDFCIFLITVRKVIANLPSQLPQNLVFGPRHKDEPEFELFSGDQRSSKVAGFTFRGVVGVLHPSCQLNVNTVARDLKAFAKITTGILIFRKSNAPDWTPDMNNGMVAWAKEYINWLETSDLGIGESQATKCDFHPTAIVLRILIVESLVNLQQPWNVLLHSTGGAQAYRGRYRRSQKCHRDVFQQPVPKPDQGYWRAGEFFDGL